MKNSQIVTIILVLVIKANLFSQITKLEVNNSFKTKKIASASGIEYLNSKYYIVSDNEASLYISDDLINFNKITIINGTNNNTIDKINKPDFEALGKIEYNNKNYLLIVSSGSKEIKRDTVFLFDILENKVVAKRNFREIYNLMKTNSGIKENTTINIEATTETSTKILLFNRGNISGDNIIYFFEKNSFIEYILYKSDTLKFTYEKFKLPTYKGVQSGFSGATMINDYTILFTASLEEATSAYSDGAILGSYIGTILTKPGKVSYKLFKDNNEVIITKLESVTIKKKINDNKYVIVASSDNDNGTSDIFEINLEIVK